MEDRLAESLATPSALGRPPEDLVERLAMLALSSPANASLRALSRISGAPATGGDLKREALKAAWAFRSLFRSPTSEGLLRNVYTPSVPTGSGAYLQLALAYSAEGGLSAVLDEFFHVVREANGGEAGASDLVASLCETLQLATGRLDVVEWDAGDMGVQRRPYPMRQHFARRYASDRARSAMIRRRGNTLTPCAARLTPHSGRSCWRLPRWGRKAWISTGTATRWSTGTSPPIRWTWSNERDVSIDTTATSSGRTSRRCWVVGFQSRYGLRSPVASSRTRGIWRTDWPMMNSVAMAVESPIGYSPKVMPAYSDTHQFCPCHAMQLGIDSLRQALTVYRLGFRPAPAG